MPMLADSHGVITMGFVSCEASAAQEFMNTNDWDVSLVTTDAVGSLTTLAIGK